MALVTFAQFGGTEEAYEKYLFLNADKEVVALYHEFVRGRGVEFVVSGCENCMGGRRGFSRSRGRGIVAERQQSMGGDWRSGGGRIGIECSRGVASWKHEGESEICVDGGDVSVDGGVRSGCDVKERGKNWKKNQRKKEAFKRKQDRVGGRGDGDENEDLVFVAGVEERPKDALRLSLEKKWALENELKAAKAARELELLKAEDLNAVKKLRERKVQGATERTMVQIEKAHASLVRSGDVPGVQPGFCQTVVDGEVVDTVPSLSGGLGECSISPSSSISEREVRELKKAFEDLRMENEVLKKKAYRRTEALKVKNGEEVAVSVKHGDVAESAKGAFDEVCGKDGWEATGDLDVDPDTLYVGLKDEVCYGGYDYSY